MREGIVDLTREEGARVLEKELYLYSIVQKVKSKFERVVNSKGISVEEFYSNNFFVDGKRGTGKTSVLLTLKKELLEGNEKGKWDIEVLETINLSVNQTGILFYLLSHIKSMIENCPKNFPLDIKEGSIYDLLSKVMAGYPYFLKCFKEDSFKKVCEMEMEELLDSLEGDFLHNFKKLIKAYKAVYGKDIVIILDDVDLIQDGKLLYKTFVELAVFLSIEHIHVIAAGDLDNVYKILEVTIKESSETAETAETIAQSFIDKVFPLPNRFKLKSLSIVDLMSLKLKVREDGNESKDLRLLDFLSQHPTFEILRRQSENLIFYLFEGFPLREFVQVLRSINERIDVIKDRRKQGIVIEDLAVSNIFSKFSFFNYYTDLELPAGGPKLTVVLEDGINVNNGVSKPKEIKFLDFNIVSLAKYNEELGRKFLTSLLLFAERNGKFRDIFKIEKAEDLRSGRKLSFFHAINIMDKRFHAFLTLWLTEIFNYAAGVLFFTPYFLVTLSMFYGLPNIFLILEEGSPTSTRGQDRAYRDPLEELRYINDFVDVENLLFILDSLDAIGELKVYTVTKKLMQNFLFHQNIPFYVEKSKKGPRAVPHYYKFWFLPYISVYLKKNLTLTKDFLYEKFAVLYEEEEKTEEQVGETADTFIEASRKLYEEIERFIRNFSVSFREDTVIQPLDIDKNVFSCIKSLINSLTKRKVEYRFYSKIRFSMYHFVSLLFESLLYRPTYGWLGRTILDSLEILPVANNKNEEENKRRFKKKLFDLFGVFLRKSSPRDEVTLIKNFEEFIHSFVSQNEIDDQELFKIIILYYLVSTFNFRRKGWEEIKKIIEDIDNILEKNLRENILSLIEETYLHERDKAFLKILAYPIWAF